VAPPAAHAAQPDAVAISWTGWACCRLRLWNRAVGRISRQAACFPRPSCLPRDNCRKIAARCSSRTRPAACHNPLVGRMPGVARNDRGRGYSLPSCVKVSKLNGWHGSTETTNPQSCRCPGRGANDPSGPTGSCLPPRPRREMYQSIRIQERQKHVLGHRNNLSRRDIYVRTRSTAFWRR
jgi:hypothetical protein